MEILAVVIGLILLVVLGGFALMMNPPSGWVDRMSNTKKPDPSHGIAHDVSRDVAKDRESGQTGADDRT